LISPLRFSEFDTWITGLRYLLGPEKVTQPSPAKDHPQPNPNDVQFLKAKLLELTELMDSLLKEAAALMEIRAKQDRAIALIFSRLNVCSFGFVAVSP
jgi:hypothetical protein